MENKWEMTTVKNIDKDMLEIIKEIVRQNTTILEAFCNPPISIEEEEKE